MGCNADKRDDPEDKRDNPMPPGRVLYRAAIHPEFNFEKHFESQEK